MRGQKREGFILAQVGNLASPARPIARAVARALCLPTSLFLDRAEGGPSHCSAAHQTSLTAHRAAS